MERQVPECYRNAFVPFWCVGSGSLQPDDIASRFRESTQYRLELANWTKDQYYSQAWRALRIGRISASIFHEFLSKKIENLESFIRNGLLGAKEKIMVKQIEHGRQQEPKALDAYKRRLAGSGRIVERVGFLLHDEHGWLGASPDGVVFNCIDNAKRELVSAIEIKCPYGKDSNTCTTFGDLAKTSEWKKHLNVVANTAGSGMMFNSLFRIGDVMFISIQTKHLHYGQIASIFGNVKFKCLHLV
jgi:hypothetical protein